MGGRRPGKVRSLATSGEYEIGKVYPPVERKLVIRPNAPLDNRPSFKPSRKA